MLEFFLGFYSMLPVLKGVIEGISKKRVFKVTAKGQTAKVQRARHIHYLCYLCILELIVVIGLLRNPAVIILNWFWLIPFLLSPFIICFLARKQG